MSCRHVIQVTVAYIACSFGEEFLQGPLESFKRRPHVCVVLPTVKGESIEFLRTVMRTRHAVAGWDSLQDLLVVHARVGEPAVGDYLVDQDAKGPHVRFDGEAVVQYCFWGRPLDGKLHRTET